MNNQWFLFALENINVIFNYCVSQPLLSLIYNRSLSAIVLDRDLPLDTYNSRPTLPIFPRNIINITIWISI